MLYFVPQDNSMNVSLVESTLQVCTRNFTSIYKEFLPFKHFQWISAVINIVPAIFSNSQVSILLVNVHVGI